MFTFQFLNDKIHNYVKKNIIVNFIIQKLKSKHTSFKKYTNWAKLINPTYTYKFQLKTTQIPYVKMYQELAFRISPFVPAQTYIE